ncbi:MAG: RNA methyltransferase [Desulfosalsimonadaceae bacterium]
MKNSWPSSLYLVLLHHPVKNKNGETIASAVTNLDLHDLSRLVKTYGAAGLYVLTPLTDQQVLAGRIIAHWQTGQGSVYNPKRREALNLVKVCGGLGEATEDISRREPGRSVKSVATCASFKREAVSFASMRQRMESEAAAFVLLLGTAWGLSDELIAGADAVLAPIQGASGYNHLSVRAAAAIILDRLLG